MTPGTRNRLAASLVQALVACMPQNERSIDDLRQEVAKAQQQRQHLKHESLEQESEGPLLTDNWNDGVRPPSAHNLWQQTESLSPQGLTGAQLENPATKVPTESSTLLNLCQVGDIEACHRFGFRLSQEGNLANAKRFFQLGCERGLWKSCNNLGWEAERHGELETAANYYSRACLRHHPGSCSNLRRVTQRLRAGHR